MLSTLRSALACIFAALAIAGLHAQTFTNPYRIPTTVDPSTLVVGDINNDGRPDILWTDATVSPRILHTLLAQPSGGYLPLPTIALPPDNTGVCLLADLNLDHHLDLACTAAHQFDSSIHVLLGNGDGSFQSPIITNITLGNAGTYAYPVIQLIGDVNGDGLPDLFVQDPQNYSSQVLLSDGKGSFKPGIQNSASAAPNPATGKVIAADVNGDGHPDLLSSTGPTVALGNGDGSFQSPITYNVSAPNATTATCTFHDMEKNGHLDAVCGYIEGGDIIGITDLVVLHGNPDGSFNTTPISDKTFGDKNTQYDGLGTFLEPIAVADLNSDGIPDVIGASGDGIAVLLGAPDLNFSTPLHYADINFGFTNGFATLFQSQIVDMNRDGIPDIVSTGPNGIYISYGKPNGTFASAFAPEVTEVIGYPTIADFNGDGIPDVAATGDTAIKLSLGKGDGTFAAPTPLSNNNGAVNFSTPLSATNAHILHGDFNGDGKLDLLAIGSTSIYQYISYILFGHGDGSFSAPIAVPNSSTLYPMYSQLTDAAVFDINHDGRSDLLSSSTSTNVSTAGDATSQISFALSNGDGTFKTVTTTVPSDPPINGFSFISFPALADFNRDGRLDAAYGSTSNAYVVTGNGDGTFNTSATALPIPPIAGVSIISTIAVATGDFDADGNQDFVVLTQYGVGQYPYPSPLATAAWVFYGNGNGTFSAPVLAATFDRNYTNIAAADLNGDGLADIVLHTSGSLGGGYAVGVLAAHTGRSFGPEVNYVAGTGLSSLAITDINGDGRPDLIFGNGDYNIRASSVTVLLNGGADSSAGFTYASSTATTLTSAPNPSNFGQTVTFTATVAAPQSSSAPTGTVAFMDGNTSLGSAPLSATGFAQFSTAALAAGTHTITAIYSGSTNDNPSTSIPLIQIVNLNTAVLSLTANPNPAALGQPVTLTASATILTFLPDTITFYDGTTSLGTAPLGAQGTATLSTSALALGTHSLTAVLAATAAPDFTLTGASITFQIGKTGTGSLQLASLNSFTGPIALTCNSPFPPNYTCILKNPTVALTPGLTASVTYTLQPTTIAAAAPSAPSAAPVTTGRRIFLAAVFPLSLLSLFGLRNRRRTHLRTLLTLALLAALASATTACGPDLYFPITGTGTYPITFTATGISQGTANPTAHSLTLNAVITP
ncbi:MAG: hypothetical protein HIU91_10605 [Acidobacteria bacterium]|nr:hypothetical protein [Acidobacteriota bacterium]